MLYVNGRLEHSLNYLRVFYEVACCKSFTRAAERLHISQPAVTRQIKNLEEILGVALFNRGSTPVELTPAGKALLSYAERAFALIEEAEEALVRYRREAILKIGTTKGYSKSTMPGIISRFQEENPGVKIVLQVDSSKTLQEGVLKGELDLAILANPDFGEKSLLFIPFRREALVCIASPRLSLDSNLRALPLGRVIEFPFIVRERGSGTHKVVMEAFEGLGRRPMVLVEASSPEFIKEWVRAGKGLSIVTASSVEEERREGKLMVLPLDPPLWLDVFVVFLKGRSREPLTCCFLRYLGCDPALL